MSVLMGRSGNSRLLCKQWAWGGGRRRGRQGEGVKVRTKSNVENRLVSLGWPPRLLTVSLVLQALQARAKRCGRTLLPVLEGELHLAALALELPGGEAGD